MSTGVPPRVGCFYAVTPGRGGDDPWFPDSLAGIEAAYAYARAASAGGPAQHVTVTRGRATTRLRTYQHGKQAMTQTKGG